MVDRTLIILTSARSGSNYLCEHLLRTWQMGWPAEWFKQPTIDEFVPKLGVSPPDDLLAYRDAILDDRHSPNGVFGVKFMRDHWEYLHERLKRACPLWANLSDVGRIEAFLPPAAWVRLRREDRVAQAVSLWRAEQTQSWIVRSEAEMEDDSALVYSFKKISEAFRRIEDHEARWDSFVAENGLDVLELTYERFCADPERHIRAIGAHLGLDPMAIDCREPENIRIQRDERSAHWCARFREELARREG